jgi:hypothetical protein
VTHRGSRLQYATLVDQGRTSAAEHYRASSPFTSSAVHGKLDESAVSLGRSPLRDGPRTDRRRPLAVRRRRRSHGTHPLA